MEKRFTNKKIGTILLILTALCWAIEPILAKLAFKDISVIQTFFLRAFFISIFGIVYLLLLKRDKIKISKKEFSWIFVISFAGTIFADLLYYFALTKIPVVNAVLIAHLQPILIIIIGYFILKEKLNKFDYIGIFVMILAGVLVSTRTLENLLSFKFATFGDLLVLIATLGWAIAGIIAKKYLDSTESSKIIFYRFFIAAVFFFMYMIMTEQSFAFNIYPILIGFIVFIGYVFYYEGLKIIGPSRAAALELITPFFAAILGFLILKEMVTLFQTIGIILLMIGIYLMSKED